MARPVFKPAALPLDQTAGSVIRTGHAQKAVYKMTMWPRRSAFFWFLSCPNTRRYFPQKKPSDTAWPCAWCRNNVRWAPSALLGSGDVYPWQRQCSLVRWCRTFLRHAKDLGVVAELFWHWREIASSSPCLRVVNISLEWRLYFRVVVSMHVHFRKRRKRGSCVNLRLAHVTEPTAAKRRRRVGLWTLTESYI